MYAWKAYWGRSSLDHRLWQRTRSQRPRVRFLRSAKNFRHCVWDFANTWKKCTFGKLEFLQLKWDKWNRTWQPNPKMMSSITSFRAIIFEPHSFQIGIIYKSKRGSIFMIGWLPDTRCWPRFTRHHRFEFPNFVLLQRTCHWLQVWPPAAYLRFFGVVWWLRLTAWLV